MASGEINLPAKMKAYPYVNPPGTGLRVAAEQEQEEINEFMDLLEEFADLPDNISQLIGPKKQSDAVGKDQWKGPEPPQIENFEKILSAFERPISRLNKTISALQKIMKIIQLFISGFNSFSKLVVSFINYGKTKLNEYTDTTLKKGVYVNVLMPPAFLQEARSDPKVLFKSQGGFDGFITRLNTSLKNTKDKNRPQYGLQDYVGGMVILLDSESLDTIWIGLKQLASMFDFINLFGLDLEPPPPTNMRGFSGFFTNPENPNEKKFGIQLEWNKNPLVSTFKIYRSRIPGGRYTEVKYVPSSLVNNKETGEIGLLEVTRRLFARIFRKEPFIPPMKGEYVYDDSDFNEGNPVILSSSSGGTTEKYVDTYIPTKKVTIEGQTYEIPYHLNEQTSKEEPVLNYYYVIRSSIAGGSIEGPNSKELVVEPKSCNDMYNIANIIFHSQSQIELISKGFGGINSWSSIQISRMLPWFQEIIDILNKFLDSFSGMVTDASDSFSDFLTQITQKFQMYASILELCAWLLEQVKNFIFGPYISFLNLDPVKGGMDVFVDRIKGAQLPEGKDSFSGPSGTSIGIVMVYGGSILDVATLKAFQKVFKFISNFFTEG